MPHTILDDACGAALVVLRLFAIVHVTRFSLCGRRRSPKARQICLRHKTWVTGLSAKRNFYMCSRTLWLELPPWTSLSAFKVNIGRLKQLESNR